jgi:hypothetical protein
MSASMTWRGAMIALALVSQLVLATGLYLGARAFFPVARVDQDAFRDWETRVSVGLEELDAVPPLTGLKSTGAGEVQQCSFSDLELFQPSATKLWTVSRLPVDSLEDTQSPVRLSSSEAVDHIVSHLKSVGWIVVRRDESQSNLFVLKRISDKRTLTISIQVFGSEIMAQVFYDGPARICTQKWGIF